MASNLPLTLKALDELELTLKCNICEDLLCDPILIGRCQHVFCKKCISEQPDACPECFLPVAAKDSNSDLQLGVLLSMCQQLRSILAQDECISKTIVTLEDESKSGCLSKIEDVPKIRSKNTFSIKGKVVSPEKQSSVLHASVKENEVINILAVAPLQAEKTLACINNENMETPKQSKTCSRSLKRFSLYSPQSYASCSRDKYKRNRCKSASHNSKEKKNVRGETALHVAAIKGNTTKVKELLKKGANPNVKDNAGWTPLHEAANHGYKEIVRLLLDFGAIVNVPGHDNITPLHDAIQNNRLEVAQFLVSRGADLQTRTSQGFTPLDLCVSDETKEYLVDACVSCLRQSDISPTLKIAHGCSNKVVFLPTGLDDSQKDKLQQCAKILKAQIVEDFCQDARNSICGITDCIEITNFNKILWDHELYNCKVTHVIAACDDRGHCNRTFKVLRGILAGKWIMNFQWIELCIEYKQKINEEVYEVPGTKQQKCTNGPKKARENAIQQFPPLFDSCKFYLNGQFSPPALTREDIGSLIQQGGGKILSREPRLESIHLEQLEVPYHIPSDCNLAGACYFVLYQTHPPRQMHLFSGPVRTVNFVWLIDSISAFQLLDPEKVDHNA